MKHILGIYISGRLWRKIHLDDYPGFPKGEKITLGRRETCDISIPQNIVSREHAYIEYDGKNVRIVDNGSLNGLEVGSKKKKEIVLKNGMKVRIGSASAETDSVVIMYVESPEPSETKNEAHVSEVKQVSKPKRQKEKTSANDTVRRMLASMADWAVVMFMCLGFCGIIVLTMGLGGIIKLLLVLGLAATIALYFALSESGASGASFGKSLFGLKVVDKNGNGVSFKRALLRTVAKGAAVFTLFLPIFGGGRCLHDVIAGTRVIKDDKRIKKNEEI